ncbi:MAG: MBL fold metallo-hydrolase [Candidatus Helarchaeota archaeon]
MVKIRWYGQGCFEIKGNDVTIATDIFPGSIIGIATPDISADIILSSHDHPDHWNRKLAKKFSNDDTTAILKWKNGDHGMIKGVKIKGVATNHDDQGGLVRGPNTVYVFEVDGIRICHCGDLGHVLNDKQVAEIGEIDILLIPTGEVFTIGLNGVEKVIKQLKPKIVVPMHYYFKGLSPIFKVLSPVSRFLKKEDKKIKELDTSEVDVSKDSLPSSTEVFVLKPP